jgi:thiosulfate/3-mercaptopyruvate sulfurtransferase
MAFVKPEDLAARLEVGSVIVIEAGWGPPKDGPQIPGSVYLDTDLLEDGWPTWRLRPIPDLAAAFGSLGLRASDSIVVTGHSAIAAARVSYALMLAGAWEVAMLDCGLRFWASHWPTAPAHAARPSARFEAVPCRSIRASLDEVESLSASGGAWIADVRSEAEFRGEVSGYSYLDARGRIPQSIHVGDADDAAGLYVHADGRLRHPEEVAALWQSRGLHLRPGRFERDTIFVCGGGWRAALAFLFARSLGLANARVCPEGWAGWSTNYISDSAGGNRQEPTGRSILIGA